jgi:adenylate cyclase
VERRNAVPALADLEAAAHDGALKRGSRPYIAVVLRRDVEEEQADACLHRLSRQDSEVSPLTVVKPVPSNARADVAPWEQEPESPQSQLNHYRNELSAHHTGTTIPTITQQPPSAIAPWASSDRQPPVATSVFGGTFYNEDLSPGFAPSEGMGFPVDKDDRRPSIASGTTVSSTGSKSSFSGRYKKKLQGFFGEDYPGEENGSGSRQNSETSSMQGGVLPAFAPGGSSRNRNNSMNDGLLRSGPPSPTSSRPRTPAAGPSSEVTPWVFQDMQVSVVMQTSAYARHGEA